jgi:hypothetical protein
MMMMMMEYKIMSKFLFGLNLGMKARRKTGGGGGKVVFFWERGSRNNNKKKRL